MKRHSLKILACIILTVFAACNHTDHYVIYGNFEADEWLVPAEGSGRVMWLGIEEGKTYEANEVVGLIDTIPLSLKLEVTASKIRALEASIPDIEAQTASLESTKAAQEREVERIRRLVERGSAEKKMLDQAEDQLTVTGNKLSAAHKALRQETEGIRAQIQSLQAQKKLQREQINRCIILNPERGVVLTRYAGVHEYVSTGHPLYKLANMDEMILRAWAPGAMLALIEPGKDVEILIDMPGGETKAYPGRVQSVAQKPQFIPTQVQSRENRTRQHYEVRVGVTNDGRIKPGMPGEMVINNDRTD